VADLLARDQVEQVVRSEGWALIRRRLEEMREQAVGQLVNATDWQNARFIQGTIGAIDTILRVPEILKAEFSEKKAR